MQCLPCRHHPEGLRIQEADEQDNEGRTQTTKTSPEEVNEGAAPGSTEVFEVDRAEAKAT